MGGYNDREVNKGNGQEGARDRLSGKELTIVRCVKVGDSSPHHCIKVAANSAC